MTTLHTQSFQPAHYQAYYCEENIWQLLQHPQFQQQKGFVLLLLPTPPQSFFAIWHQRASSDLTLPLCWDYHVIYTASAHTSDWYVWDLDTQLPCPCPLTLYLNASFEQIPEPFLPHLRCFPQYQYQSTFSSDRRHMRQPTGQFIHPPPPWPIIQNPSQPPHQLETMLDLQSTQHPTAIPMNAMHTMLHFKSYIHNSRVQK